MYDNKDIRNKTKRKEIITMNTMRFIKSSYCKYQSWSEQFSSEQGFITARSFDKSKNIVRMIPTAGVSHI